MRVYLATILYWNESRFIGQCDFTFALCQLARWLPFPLMSPPHSRPLLARTARTVQAPASARQCPLAGTALAEAAEPWGLRGSKININRWSVEADQKVSCKNDWQSRDSKMHMQVSRLGSPKNVELIWLININQLIRIMGTDTDQNF